MRAAVLTRAQSRLDLLDDIQVADPGAGQVLVAVSHCGICHSDLTIIESGIEPIPIILGHEAAGVVEAVGPGVTAVSAGDHVVLVAIAPCGRCYWCVRGKPTVCEKAMSFMSGTLPDGSTGLSRDGETVYRGLGVGGFASIPRYHSIWPA
jgi:Zn-dependent alcohol dehydrogenase